MKARHCKIASVSISAVALFMAIGFTVLTNGNPAPARRHVGSVDDWTHHHIAYSDPGSYDEVKNNPQAYSRWLRLQYDTRYILQQMKRNHSAAGGYSPEVAHALTQVKVAALLAPSPASKSTPVKRDWSMDMGSSASVGAGEYPAKYSFSTTSVGNCGTASQPDYVVYNTGLAGSTTQANIIAYDNMYSGCAGTKPSVYWSYFTGTGSVATSPVLSLDGTKVAFIESGSSTATLRILKWASGNGTNYSVPNNISSTNNHANTYAGASTNTAWSSCTTSPCMISVAFQADLHSDTTSAPWYDYDSDTLWVGDSGGYLHKFSGVFNGTPGEYVSHSGGTCGTSCVWPVSAGAGSALTAPVFDSTNSLLFVGVNGAATLVSVNSSTGAISTSSVLASGSDSVSIDDAPLVDPAAGTAGEVYVFVQETSSTHLNAVVQFAEGSISGSSGNRVTFGNGNGTTPIYAGSFDNAYYTSANSASPSGHLWVCGYRNSGSSYFPNLYSVAINSNALGTVTTGPELSATTTPCSPVTEFCVDAGTACTSSQGTDYVFVSPHSQPSTPTVSGCSGSTGCVISYTVSGATATLAGAGPAPGGTSGMVVDTQNTSISGTLQLYYSTLSSMACGGNGTLGTGTGGCAVQASQTAP